MSFPISTFESHIPKGIADKGLAYFSDNQVDNLAQDGNGWEADVYGTDTYTVEVDVEDGKVTEWFCDCPYDWGPICKHVAAVMFAIRDEMPEGEIDPKAASSPQKRRGRKPKSAIAKATPTLKKIGKQQKPSKDPVEEIISKLDLSEMRQLLRYLAKREDGVKSHLLTKYSGLITANTRSHIKALVKSIIQSHTSGRHGFIEYKDANRLGSQLYTLLREGAGGNPLSTVDLCEEVISQLAEAYQHSDDSSGSMGSAIEMALELLVSLVRGNNDTPEEVVGYIFKIAMKGGMDEKYDGFDWGSNFRGLAADAARNEQQSSELITMLEQYIEKKEKEEYGRFSVEGAAHLKYKVIEKWQDDKAAESYLLSNLRYASFRRSALNKAMVEKRYDDVRQLSNDGIVQSEQDGHPGTVNEWKKWLMRLAETTGDKATLIDLTEKIFLERGEMEYFRELKELVTPANFEEKVEKYIQHFNSKESRFARYGSIFNYQVAAILEAENRLPELMALLQKAPSLDLLDRYFKLLAKHNKTEFVALYDQRVRKKMEQTSDRSGYRECCRYLNKLIKLGGTENAEQVVKDWRETYPRRRAMLEELGKVKWKV